MDCLLQFKKDSGFALGLLRDNLVYDISNQWPSLKDFLDYVGKNNQEIIPILASIKLDKGQGMPYEKIYDKILPPIYSEKIYGLGITYKISEIDRVKRSGDSAHGNAVETGRLISFYKGDHHNCVGPTGTLNVRGDSNITTPEPELAAVLSDKGKILGYTVFNDITAYDLEMKSSLFTPEAKEYIGCCSMGPIFCTKRILRRHAKIKSDPKNN